MLLFLGDRTFSKIFVIMLKKKKRKERKIQKTTLKPKYVIVVVD